MKKLLMTSAVLFLAGITGSNAVAQPSLRINIPLPPLIHFPAPPSVVVLPESRVYVVPDLREEFFFYAGWWWRPWGGRWYRSQHYDRGWAHYGGVPSFYRGVPPGWREDYRNHRWGAGAWNHRPIHHDELQRNWRGWHDNRHWEQPRYRQHEFRRDGRPFAGHDSPGRRPEPSRPGNIHREPARQGPNPGRRPEPIHPGNVQRESPRQGPNPGPGRPAERATPDRGNRNRPEHESGNRARPGGHEEPRREKR
jgi:hypothetical protein